MRYNANGTLDASFGTGGKLTTSIGIFEEGRSVAVQNDGKIVVAGYAYIGNSADFALLRYNGNGTLDTSFGTGGKVTTPIGNGYEKGNAVAVQADGRILVAGYSDNGSNSDFALVRYNTNGTLDTSFGTGGRVTTLIGSSSDGASSVAVQSDGKIVVAGHSGGDAALVRYTPSGALDSSFGIGGKVTTDLGGLNFEGWGSVVLQNDGRIVVAGFRDSFFSIARFHAASDSSGGAGGYSFTASVIELHGSISPGSLQNVPYGASVTFTATPDFGYRVDGWWVNGLPVQTGGNSYTINGVSANTVLEVMFRRFTPEIIFSEGFAVANNQQAIAFADEAGRFAGVMRFARYRGRVLFLRNAVVTNSQGVTVTLTCRRGGSLASLRTGAGDRLYFSKPAYGKITMRGRLSDGQIVRRTRIDYIPEAEALIANLRTAVLELNPPVASTSPSELTARQTIVVGPSNPEIGRTVATLCKAAGYAGALTGYVAATASGAGTLVTGAALLSTVSAGVSLATDVLTVC